MGVLRQRIDVNIASMWRQLAQWASGAVHTHVCCHTPYHAPASKPHISLLTHFNRRFIAVGGARLLHDTWQGKLSATHPL